MTDFTPKPLIAVSDKFSVQLPSLLTKQKDYLSVLFLLPPPSVPRHPPSYTHSLGCHRLGMGPRSWLRAVCLLELAPRWDGRLKQMTLYLCPCRKCHPGLRLWDRQHADEKRLRPGPVNDAEDRGGLVDKHHGPTVCHHPKGNRFASITSLLGILC